MDRILRFGPTEVTDEEIAKRAYEIWEARGCPEGDGSDNWEAAKAELTAARTTRRKPLRRLFNRIRGRAASL